MCVQGGCAAWTTVSCEEKLASCLCSHHESIDHLVTFLLHASLSSMTSCMLIELQLNTNPYLHAHRVCLAAAATTPARRGMGLTAAEPAASLLPRSCEAVQQLRRCPLQVMMSREACIGAVHVYGSTPHQQGTLLGRREAH